MSLSLKPTALAEAGTPARVGLIGATRGFRGDVVATAKRGVRPGELLNGEGSHMVFGKLMARPRPRSPAADFSSARCTA